jgi:glucokinase
MSTFLLADIGGTQARFALSAESRLQPVQALDVRRHHSPESAIAAFIDAHARGRTIDCAVIAVAGPVTANRARLTNGTWQFDGEQLGHTIGIRRVKIVNDLEALAWAIPLLGPDDCRKIGGGEAVAGAPVAVVAPGTGLGVACLLPGHGVLPGEGGHASLPAADDHAAAVIALLRKRFDHVSAERALSGQGLENLHAALAELDGAPPQTPSAREISEVALAGTDQRARRAIDLFFSMLGGVAGDLALTFGARGGVYIGGGIVPVLVDELARSDFRHRFEHKGRLSPYVSSIATKVIVRPDPAFLGLGALAQAEH